MGSWSAGGGRGGGELRSVCHHGHHISFPSLKKGKTVIKQEINAYKEYYKYENIRSVFPKIYPSFEETGFFMNYIN